MSRVAKRPVSIPKNVEVKINGREVVIKGGKDSLNLQLHPQVAVTMEGDALHVSLKTTAREAQALGGTTRALLSNMVIGVSEGFKKKLELVGVGYRAQIRGKALNLTLGHSHPVEYPIPVGIVVETPSLTEIIIKGADKQRVGQVAAEIRAVRRPDPYKGKGVRYAGEHIVLKEAKKK